MEHGRDMEGKRQAGRANGELEREQRRDMTRQQMVTTTLFIILRSLVFINNITIIH